ncbi:MAG: DUF3011 domain-containing protein [Bryobacteraceae bacterium]|nr:DUF3011 domain-containing protein [Bryobacteraceae bacterium]
MTVLKAFAGMFLAGSAVFAQSTFSCASDDMRRHYCSADTRNGVQIVRQRSDASCIQGSTWGFDRRGVWVDRGCRADFAIGNYAGNRGGFGNGGYGNGGYGNGGYGNNNGGYSNGRNGGYSSGGSITSCNSDDMGRHFCTADTRGGVSLYRQHSDAACVQGRTWGYDRNRIWVDRGCRAEFQTGSGVNSGYGNGRNGSNGSYRNTPNGNGRGRWRPYN